MARKSWKSFHSGNIRAIVLCATILSFAPTHAGFADEFTIAYNTGITEPFEPECCRDDFFPSRTNFLGAAREFDLPATQFEVALFYNFGLKAGSNFTNSSSRDWYSSTTTQDTIVVAFGAGKEFWAPGGKHFVSTEISGDLPLRVFSSALSTHSLPSAYVQPNIVFNYAYASSIGLVSQFSANVSLRDASILTFEDFFVDVQFRF